MVDFGMLSDTFQEQPRAAKEEVKKESPNKKVAFKGVTSSVERDSPNLNKKGILKNKGKSRAESLESDESVKQR